MHAHFFLNILQPILEAVKDFVNFLSQRMNWLWALLIAVGLLVLKFLVRMPRPTEHTKGELESETGKPRLEDSSFGQGLAVVLILGFIAFVIFAVEKGCEID